MTTIIYMPCLLIRTTSFEDYTYGSNRVAILVANRNTYCINTVATRCQTLVELKQLRKNTINMSRLGSYKQ